MSEFEVAGVAYRSGRLNAREQFHVARRLAPIFSTLTEAAATGGEPDFAPIAQAVASMPDGDADFVLTKTLAVVERKQGTVWVRLQSSNGALMFEDLGMMEMLQIAWAVLQENLSGFFPAAPPTSPGPGAQSPG